MTQTQETAERSQLGHVLVIAGPSCVGKTTLATRLLNGDMPRVAEALGLPRGSTCRLLPAKEWRNLERASCDAVLLHYDFTRRGFWAKGAERDRALAILDRAQSITFLTLWELPEEIKRRFHAKVRSLLADHFRNLRIQRAWQTYQWFRLRRPFIKQSDQMWLLYREWFDFTARFDRSPHWVLRSTGVDQAPSPLPRSRESPFWGH